MADDAADPHLDLARKDLQKELEELLASLPQAGQKRSVSHERQQASHGNNGSSGSAARWYLYCL